jgi:hypothetical protein
MYNICCLQVSIGLHAVADSLKEAKEYRTVDAVAQGTRPNARGKASRTCNWF